MSTRGRGASGKRLGIWLASVAVAAACAPRPKTVANVSSGVTGCPEAQLAVFDYNPAKRTWSAVCTEKVYVCSDGRGGTRCTPQQADTIDLELVVRAKALLEVPNPRRQWFINKDLRQGTWEAFALLVAEVKALSDAQFSVVDPRRLFRPRSASFESALEECVGDDGVLKVEVSASGGLHPPLGSLEHSCVATLRNDPALAPLKAFQKQSFYVVPNLRHLQPVQRPELTSTPSPKPAAASGAAAAASDVATASSPADASGASPELDAAVRSWLDRESVSILACTDKERSALLVQVDRDGAPEVSVRGAAAGSPESGCVRSALGKAPTFPAGPAVILHVVKASP